MKNNSFIGMFNNRPSKILGAIGAVYGISSGLKNKKALQYTLMFGTFGALMGLVVHNTIEYEIKNK